MRFHIGNNRPTISYNRIAGTIFGFLLDKTEIRRQRLDLML